MVSELRVDKIHNEGGDNDSGLDMSTNDTVKVKIAGTNIMTIKEDGELELGTTSSSDSEISFLAATDGASRINFGDSGDADIGVIQYEHDGNAMVFKTNASERMRIDSSGNVLIGATSTFDTQDNSNGSDSRFGYISSVLHLEGNSNAPLRLKRNSDNGTIVAFNRGGVTGVGSISVTTSATAFNTSSDYRLKENVVTDWDATSRLKQLKPSRFNFKTDKDTTVDGFLAHEVSSIVPEAITGEKDAVDSDGKPIMQGIDQSKLVPLLVKTIQELEARIAVLEAK